MAEWTNTNRACKTLWTTLTALKQIGNTSFANAGALAMKDLTYYNPLASADARRIEANMLADQMDNIFINKRLAKYEPGIDRTKALSSLVGILTDEAKQVQDLAATADAAYSFLDEE